MINPYPFYEVLKGRNTKQFNHVAVITTAKGAILSIGTNTKTHPINKYNTQYRSDILHAEISAITKVDRSVFFNGTAIIVYSLRFGRSGSLLNAKPCKVCQDIMARYTNIKTIYFSNDKGQLEKLQYGY